MTWGTGGTTFGALSGGGQLCLLFVCVRSAPHVLESRRARGVLDCSMAEPVLDQPRVMAGIGQGVAAGVAQHVSMDPERQLGARANGFHEHPRRL